MPAIGQWQLFPTLDISKVQDDEVGDGTTSVVVLASELLRVNGAQMHRFHCLLTLLGNGRFDCTKNSSANHHRWLAQSHQ